ncbi:MAG: metal ABC transporter permease [Candidatus Poribacteria bacterium]|nr:metal ABC transporter permease [Candidatus Poribacteria bacterium]MDE0503719.1 metal ABC transporter permease [Candidatus Poribacteria bacterium]
MMLLELGKDLILDYTLRTVALGSATLGVVSGALGCYAVLRKQSLLGDAISHAALPGVALAFLFTQSKAPLVLVCGAAIAGWVATLFVIGIVNNTRIKEDSALGLVLSVFFSVGLVLLTVIQKMPTAKQSGLDTFLFGQAAALLERDVVTMASLGGMTLMIMLFFWKEFKLLCFDSAFGASLGFPMAVLDVLLITLLVIAIVLGLQTVGVVLMSAMVVAPAAAARQWTDRLGGMVVLSAFFGAIAGVGGAVISSSAVRIPTGPTIVLSISAIVVFSIAFAPNRGLVWNWVRSQRERKKLQIEVVLNDLYTLASQHADLQHSHSTAVLLAMSANRGNVRHSLRELVSLGWVENVNTDEWALTSEGVIKARYIAERQE